MLGAGFLVLDNGLVKGPRAENVQSISRFDQKTMNGPANESDYQNLSRQSRPIIGNSVRCGLFCYRGLLPC